MCTAGWEGDSLQCALKQTERSNRYFSVFEMLEQLGLDQRVVSLADILFSYLPMQGYFELVDRKKGVVQLTKSLDYDVGLRLFELQILAKVGRCIFNDILPFDRRC